MDGLEAIEINFSVCKNIIDFRIDASTYKKDYVRTDKILRSMNPSTIEDKMVSIQNFGAYSLCNYITFTEQGVPFLMTQNVRHNYIDWSNVRYIDDQSHLMLHKSHCKRNQVLVTMAGEYLGRVAVYDKDFVCSSNQAIAKVTLQDGVSPYYVATFLNSRYGQNQINRFKTITGQPNINMALIKSLMIPEFSKELSNSIERMVKTANERFDRSKDLIVEAERWIEHELALDGYTESNEICSIKTYSTSFNTSGRLDAEYYQEKYDEYELLIKSYYNGYGLIGDICKIKDQNFVPVNNCEYSYIELANVGSQGNITECDVMYGSELPTRARRKVNANDVIISSVEGSLSKCALVTSEYDGFVCTNGFFVITCNDINSETLMILFKNRIIQGLLKKGCSGTILSAIGKEELSKIPLPIISQAIQELIKDLVQKSNEERKNGEQLLQQAVSMLEDVIENGEQ